MLCCRRDAPRGSSGRWSSDGNVSSSAGGELLADQWLGGVLLPSAHNTTLLYCTLPYAGVTSGAALQHYNSTRLSHCFHHHVRITHCLCTLLTRDLTCQHTAASAAQPSSYPLQPHPSQIRHHQPQFATRAPLQTQPHYILDRYTRYAVTVNNRLKRRGSGGTLCTFCAVNRTSLSASVIALL